MGKSKGLNISGGVNCKEFKVAKTVNDPDTETKILSAFPGSETLTCDNCELPGDHLVQPIERLPARGYPELCRVLLRQ